VRKALDAQLPLYFVLCLLLTATAGQAATITVAADSILGPVNSLIFGNALPHGHGDILFQSDDSFAFDSQTLDLICDLRPSIVRFPGGQRANEYFWEDGIGPQELRPAPRKGQKPAFDFSYGTDEHLSLCRMIGAEAFITVNYGAGILGDSLSTEAPLSQRLSRAADWVEYCNQPDDGSNPRGGIDWAARRAENGHPDPYGVKYWEIGNEINGQGTVGRTDVQTYAQDLIAFSEVMKSVDPTIKIGAVGMIVPHWRQWWNSSELEWNATLLRDAGQAIDFLVVHCHYPGQNDAQGSDLYHIALAAPHQAIVDLTEIAHIIDQESQGSVGIVPGENGFSCGPKLNHELKTTLLAGLHLADLWMKLLQHSSALNIEFACGWTLLSQVCHGDIGYQPSSNKRFHRPESYAQQVIRHHIGDLLVAHSVECGTFSTVEVAHVPALSRVPELSVCATIDSSGDSLSLLVINRRISQDVEATIQLEGFEYQSDIDIWCLNGPSIVAHNEDNPTDVTIQASSHRLTDGHFTHLFPAHSLTAIELTRSHTDDTPPTMTDLQVAEITGYSARVSWATDEPATSRVEYGAFSGDYSHAAQTPGVCMAHEVTVDSLDSEILYYFRAVSSDTLGNTAFSEEQTFWSPDISAPHISELMVTAVTESSATLTWETDEPADARVEYFSDPACPRTIIDTVLTHVHTISLIGLQSDTRYNVSVVSADSVGNLSQETEQAFVTSAPRTSVHDQDTVDPLPSEFRLRQNYPNPFNGSTTIQYQLPRDDHVGIRIYNALGQLVKTLVDEHQPPGQYQVSWDGKDGGGVDVASGIYFCFFQGTDHRDKCKMTVLR
jgi:alpha-N-arabinofuranosidase